MEEAAAALDPELESPVVTPSVTDTVPAEPLIVTPCVMSWGLACSKSIQADPRLYVALTTGFATTTPASKGSTQMRAERGVANFIVVQNLKKT